MIERATAFLRGLRGRREGPPRLKVGDRVEVRSSWSCWDGWTGKVIGTETVSEGRLYYWVEIPMVLGDGTLPQMFRPDELTRVGT